MRYSFLPSIRRLFQRQRLMRFGCLVASVILLIVYQYQPKSPTIRKARAANLPSGFVETLILDQVTNPTGMFFAPDGRLFYTQQNGVVRVYKNGALLPTPFINVNADTTMDLGLMGLTFDPNFSSNHYVYLYYTATTPTVHNRLMRVTANGDVADMTTLTSLLEFDTLSSGSTMNIGGTFFFGPDGKLYLGVGDVENASNAQMTTTLYGKILRMNPDGSVPTDNPFYGMYSGNNRLIYAMGLRNPYTFSIQPGTGRLLVNDVGKDGWEEIDDIVAGANYGWPVHEGFAIDTKYQNPLYAYPHLGSGVSGCAITGGTFYNPSTNQFPGQYVGEYFFSDYCSGWIKVYDVVNNIVSDFATGISFPINLKLSPDGSLYYLARGMGGSTGQIYKIQYIASQPPSIAEQPANTLVSNGYTASLTVSVSGTTPMNYQWQRNDVNITGANSATYTTPPMSLSDSGTQFRCIATNAFGTVTSNEASVTVTSDLPPVGTIVNPPSGTMYNAGDTINYSATATDAEDGTLPASAYTWWIDFQHNTHTHPFMVATSGMTGGSFTIPNVGETSANTWYRIYLTVTDSVGLTNTSYREIFPHKSTLTLKTSPSGLSLSLDDTPQNTPFSSPSVVNMTRKLSAPTQQLANGRIWVFDHWSDGGASTHTILTPATNTTYTAVYTALGPFVEQSGQVTLEAEDYDDNISRGSQAWIFRNGLFGFSGTGYMRADPDENVSYLTSGYSANSPELRYLVQFNSTGKHYIWARMNVPSIYSDTIHVGLDNTETPSGERIQYATSSFDTWGWTRTTLDGTNASLNITSTGMHTVNIWMGKDGVRVDRLVLTTDPNFTPSGNGPAESSRSPGISFVHTMTIGIFKDGEFYLSKDNVAVAQHFVFGVSGWQPIIGDWNANGVDTVGISNPTNGQIYLSNDNTTVAQHFVFGPGSPWKVLSGDWDGNGTSTIGLYNTTNGEFYLSNDNATVAQHFVFGPGGSWTAIVGDWDGNGTSTIGIYNTANGEFYLSNDNATVAQHFYWGPGGVWQAIVGDWDGDGLSTIGLYNTTDGEFYLSNDNVNVARHFVWGPGGSWQPVVGYWGSGGGSAPNPGPTAPPAPSAPATPTPVPTFIPK